MWEKTGIDELEEGWSVDVDVGQGMTGRRGRSIVETKEGRRLCCGDEIRERRYRGEEGMSEW